MEEITKFVKNSVKDSKLVEITTFSLQGAEALKNGILTVLPDAQFVIKEDKSIIGGHIIKVGDMVLDESYKSRIEKLGDGISKTKITSSDTVVDDIVKSTSNIDLKQSKSEVGVVTTLKDGICMIEGLMGTMYQEVLLFESGIKAIAFNLESDGVGAIIMGDYTQIKVGDIVRRSGEVVSVPVSEKLLGRVLDPLGNTIDSGGKLEIDKTYPVEKLAPAVLDRQPVFQPLQTGIKAIDVLVPIGKGQRELILGDRQTGKTTLAIDTIINQKDSGVISIYVAIGQKLSKVVNIVERLRSNDALKNTIVIAVGASDPAPLLYLAPYSATAMAEYFADKGKDVLIVYDDLSKHAVAYRELSLLLRRPPGREAFPGDVFYLHSRLLERSVKYSEKLGGGSITSLPIIETQAGDISAYVPTNVISITDGQIFLESNLFNKGVRPAINVGLSVSRVGGAAQTKAMKKVAGKIKISLAQYRELEAFAQFSGDLDENTKLALNRGQKTIEILKQDQYSPFALSHQVVSIYAVNNGFFDSIESKDVAKKEAELIEFMEKKYKKLSETLNNGDWSDVLEASLNELCKKFFEEDGN